MSPSASTYRAEAERCRQLAITCRDTEAAQRWRALTQEYEELAKAFDSIDRRIQTLSISPPQV